jgi:hypothetical protein
MRRWFYALSLFGVVSRAEAHELPSAGGPNGLLHTPSAIASEPWTVRGSLLVDWFRASNFLCTDKHPCRGATSDEHRHSGATVTVGATFFRGLDAYVSARAYSNANSRSEDLHEVLGDTTIGARYSAGRVLLVGGGAEAVLAGGSGNLGLSGSGTSFRARALATFAGDALARPAPFRVHLGFAYLLDNSGALVRDVERERGAPITRIERYGLGISKVDRFEVSLGAELLAAHGHLRPFVEYGLALATRRHGVVCVSDEPCRASFSSMPSQITLGARIAPVVTESASVSFLVALDLGLTSRFSTDVAPNAPYTVWLGVAMSMPTAERPPKVVVERVEVAVPPPFVTLRGFVHVAGAKTPIPNAIATYVDSPRPPLATDEKGYFGDEVEPGTYELRVHAEGYRDNTCGGTAVAAGKSTVTLDCPLEPLAP